MNSKLVLLTCLALMAGLFLAGTLAGSTASVSAGLPPTGTPQGVLKMPSTYSLDLAAQPARHQVSVGRMHFDSMSVPSPSVRSVAPTSNGSGWQRNEFQDFEDTFPDPPLWLSSANMADDGLIYAWDDRNCRALSGSYSSWAIGSSSEGDPDCGAAYANGVQNRMLYGPFDLSQATDAELQFALWADVEGDGANCIDEVRWGASVDGEFFAGWRTAGQTGDWVPANLNLDTVPILGDLMGQPEVYVSWEFESNESNPTSYEGAFVDDAALWVYTDPSPTPPPTPPTPPPTPTLPITCHTTVADFAGGRSHDNTVVVVEQGDGALTLATQGSTLEAWERLPSLPRELFHFAAVTAKGHLFVIGGNSPDGGYQRGVYSAVIQDDGLLGRWVELTKLPQARIGHAALVANDHLFVLGGFNFNGIQATVLSARINDDGTLGEWASLPELLEPLLYHAAVSAHGYIYVLGGQKSIEPVIVSDTIYQAKVNANGTLGDWEALPIRLPRPSYFHAAVATCDHLYLMGGGDETFEWNAVHQAEVHADGSLGGWSPTTPLSKTLLAHTATAIRGGILVTGGWNSPDPFFSSQKKVYWAPLAQDCSLNSWVELTPLPYSTHSHVLAATDRYVYNLGGMNAAPRYFASVLMAPLQLGDNSVQQGGFNHQFHLGDNYAIESLRWTEEGSGDTEISLRYRVGNADTGEYGPWSDYTSTNPITVNAMGGFLEYQLEFEGGNGLSDKYVTEVSLNITPLDSVYLPLVIKD